MYAELNQLWIAPFLLSRINQAIYFVTKVFQASFYFIGKPIFQNFHSELHLLMH